LTSPTAYHQIGLFIVNFQHVERSINELLILLADSDPETISILINELSFSQRLKTVDVLFARFIDLRRESDLTIKTDFHKLMSEFGRLGERRNDLVHSKYMSWINIEGNIGLIRENSKLRASKGIREEQEEELLPDSFSTDLSLLSKLSSSLESFRLKIIDYLYPDISE